MGFIKEDNIIDWCDMNLNIYWTDIGKKYLYGGKNGRKTGIRATYFSLGDSDTNYNVSDNPILELPHNFVPDISGFESNCLLGTKHNFINNHINFLSANLIKTKKYYINLIDNTNQSTNSCNINDLIYKIFYNGSNIFINDKIYSVYTAKNIDFRTKLDAEDYINKNIINNIDASFVNNVSVVSGIKQNIDNTYSISNIGFIITTNVFNDQVGDNESYICSNSLNTEIRFETVITSNPNPSNFINNSNQTQILGCGDVIPTTIDCSQYYSISAFNFNVELSEIWECIVSNFDGWIE